MKTANKVAASPIFRIVMGLLLAGLAFWLAMREVDLPALSAAWRLVDKGLAVAALLAAVMANLGKVARWRVLLAAGESLPGAWKTLGLFFAGQLANTFVPGRVGDLGRAFGVGGRGTRTTFALGTVVIEKTLDTVMYALLIVVLLASGPLPGWMRQSAYLLIGIGMLALVLGWWLSRSRRDVDGLARRLAPVLPGKVRERLQPHLEAGLSSLDVFRRRGEVGRLLFWTAWIWVSALAVNFIGLMAFRLPLPLTASLLLMIALQLGISASLTPAAVGVFEFLCVLSLAVFGVARTDAFGFGVLLHGIVLLPILVAGSAALISFSIAKRRLNPPMRGVD